MLSIPEKILVCLLAVIFAGCEPLWECEPSPPGIPVRFIDNAGNDLLNPSFAGSYKIGDIQLTYFDGTTLKPVEFKVDTFASTGQYVLTTTAGSYPTNDPTFFLRLSNTDTDTLHLQMGEIRNKCTAYVIKEFRYNDTATTAKPIAGSSYYTYQIIKK